MKNRPNYGEQKATAGFLLKYIVPVVWEATDFDEELSF